MQFTIDYDPAYLHLLHESDFAETLLDGRRPSNPVFSYYPAERFWKAMQEMLFRFESDDAST